jgi:cell division protein FtsI (penicillin-binding protein 3)
MSRGFASNYRIVLVATALFLCFGGLGGRLVWLHVLNREELVKQIAKTRRQVIVEMAQRGDIRDRQGVVFATSVPQIVVAFDPMMVRPEDEAKWPQLAKLLELPLAEVRGKLTTKYRAVSAVNPAGPSKRAGDTDAPLLKLNLPGAVAAGAKAEPAGPESAAQAAVTRPAAVPESVGAADADSNDDVEVETAADAQGRRAIRWTRLSDHVSESTYTEIQQLGLHGLCAPERRYARVYPHNELAAQVIGYANHDGHGAAGLEAYADFYLAGRNGWREGERDGRNHELAQFQTRNAPSADGYSVVLSIDSTIQYLIERELDRIAKTYQPLKATIIVSNPNTGFILGMANYPSFNPNEYNLVPKGEMARMNNIAVTDAYEPGSVFKIVAASAALEEGLVTPATQFDCGIDHIEYLGKVRGLPREDHPFHQLTVAEIIAHSSNRGAAQLAMKVGEEKFYDYARAFGFGSKLGFGIGLEEIGTVHKPGTPEWDGTTITRMPMGQSVTATALQMHQAMSTIANSGLLLRPQVIWEIRDPSNAVIYRYAPTQIRRVISENTARTVARLLQKVASKDGTAPEAAISINGVDYEVAGKTGTAQKYEDVTLADGRVVKRPSDRHHVVSFIGFFPATRPQVAISVVVDDADAHAPGGVAYGAKVAAPAFKNIGLKLIPILSITPPNQPAHLDFVAATEGGRR